MLLTISGFSQTSYPKVIIEDSDTLVMVTIPQLQKINLGINELQALRTENTILQGQLECSDSLIITMRNSIIVRDSLVTLQKLKYDESQKMCESLEKSLSLQKKKHMGTAIGVGAGCTLLGIIIGVLIKK